MSLELFNERKEVIPTTAIQAERMVAQLVENFLHFKSGGDGFEQHRGANRTERQAQVLLSRTKDIVPECRFQVRFQLGKVVVRPRALLQECVDIVKQVEGKIDNGTGRDLTIDGNVRLVQVPAAGTDKERGNLVVQGIRLAIGWIEMTMAEGDSKLVLSVEAE